MEPTTVPDNVVDDREGCGDESEAVVGAPDADASVDFIVLGALIVAVLSAFWRDIFRYMPL